MSAVRFPLLAVLLLSACDGNPLSSKDEGAAAPPAVTSVSTLSTTTGTLSASGSVERHEVQVNSNGADDNGNGFAFQDGQILYDADADTFEVDNIAFDGDNVYARTTSADAALDDEVRAFRSDATATDPMTGVSIDQFSYRALYGESATGRGKFAIVRTGAYVPYGFGGFIYMREGGVTLPTQGQSQYAGSYTALRDANGIPADGRKLAYVTGDMTVAIDWNDFNTSVSSTGQGTGVSGSVTNRRIFSLAGADITNDVLATINEDKGLDDTPLTELPTLLFSVGPGVMDLNGEMEGELTSSIPTTDGGSEVLESGNYYAVLSGEDADEIVGVLVVTSSVNGTTLRETGGFLLYRD